MRARLLWLLVWTLALCLANASCGEIPAKGRIDLNTATVAQLRALPGMGDEYVRRVIAGRPYTAKNQLVTRGVLPQGEYGRIAALVVARRARQ